MASILTDQQIRELLGDRKPIPHEYKDWLRRRKIRNKPEKRVRREIRSDAGRKFQIIVRESLKRTNNFSIILRHISGHDKHTLIRCNGFHRPHQNTIEKKSGSGIAGFPANTTHVHYLTERYQIEGLEKADQYAEPCSEYHDLNSALSYFVAHFGCYLVGGGYASEFPLFEG